MLPRNKCLTIISLIQISTFIFAQKAVHSSASSPVVTNKSDSGGVLRKQIVSENSIVPDVPRIKLFDYVEWLENGAYCLFHADPRDKITLVYGGMVKQMATPYEFNTAYTTGNDKIWIIKDKGTGNAVERILLSHSASLAIEDWKREGVIVDDLENPHGLPQMLVPLEKVDYFLGVDLFSGFSKDGVASFIAIFKRGPDDVITIDSCVKMPFGELDSIGKPFPQSLGKKNTAYCQPIHSLLRPNFPEIIHAGKCIFLTDSRAGILWAIDDRNGSVRKVFNLADIDLSEVDKLSFIGHWILGLQPTIDGDLIVATQEKHLLSCAASYYPVNNSDEACFQAKKEEFDAFVKDFREVTWFRIHSEDLGISSDSEGPTAWMFDNAALGKFKFIVTTDGRIITNYNRDWNSALSSEFLAGDSKKATPSTGDPVPRGTDASQPNPAKAHGALQVPKP